MLFRTAGFQPAHALRSADFQVRAPMSRLEAGGPEEHEGHSTFMPFIKVDGTTLFTDCARLASQ
jgi:hypothetical protein